MIVSREVQARSSKVLIASTLKRKEQNEKKIVPKAEDGALEKYRR